MVNPYAGEVALVIDGRRHVAKLTLGALAEAEAALALGAGAGSGGGAGCPGSSSGALTSTALALRAKEKAVDEFHRRAIAEQNVRGTFRATTRGNVSLGGYHAGRAAAERAHKTRRR